MTLDKLLYTYNFHDCYVITPFTVRGDSVTVVFDLAKHLQYSDIKSKRDPLYADKKHNLIIKIKFCECTSVKATIRNCKSADSKQPESLCESKEKFDIIQLDAQFDFNSVCISEEGRVFFVFDGPHDQVGEISFSCKEATIEYESLLGESECDALWENSKL